MLSQIDWNPTLLKGNFLSFFRLRNTEETKSRCVERGRTVGPDSIDYVDESKLECSTEILPVAAHRYQSEPELNSALVVRTTRIWDTESLDYLKTLAVPEDAQRYTLVNVPFSHHRSYRVVYHLSATRRFHNFTRIGLGSNWAWKMTNNNAITQVHAIKHIHTNKYAHTQKHAFLLTHWHTHTHW